MFVWLIYKLLVLILLKKEFYDDWLYISDDNILCFFIIISYKMDIILYLVFIFAILLKIDFEFSWSFII